MSNKLRIALIGKTGNGKSSTGNMILQRKQFECAASTNGVTFRIQSELGRFQNTDFKLTDTPGVFDPIKSDEEIVNELRKVIDELHPGPHVFLIVLKSTRFTEEDKLSVKALGDIFGQEVFKHSIVVFTRLDDLAADGSNLSTYVNTGLNENLRDLLNKCNNRYVGFNNRIGCDSNENQQQVRELFEKIDQVTSSNMDNYFRGQIFEYTSQNIQTKKEAIINSPNLTEGEKTNKLDQIEANVNTFFTNLTSIFAGIRALMSMFKMLCNIV